LGNVSDFDKMEIISSQKFIFSKANLLYLRENTNTISEIEVLEKTFDKFYYKDQILSIFTTKEIVNYKIVTP
jgi:radical SAM superfamily enzyme